MSPYGEFPWVTWVQWESHGNGKYYTSSTGMGKMGMGGNDNSMFPISHQKQGHISLRSTYIVRRKIGIGEKWPNLDICIIIWFSVVFDTTRLLLVVSLVVICFMMSMKNSNRCDEILAWDWQREGIGITDRTGNGMRIKRGWTWEWEWGMNHWEREGVGSKKKHFRSSLMGAFYMECPRPKVRGIWPHCP